MRELYKRNAVSVDYDMMGKFVNDLTTEVLDNVPIWFYRYDMDDLFLIEEKEGKRIVCLTYRQQEDNLDFLRKIEDLSLGYHFIDRTTREPVIKFIEKTRQIEVNGLARFSIIPPEKYRDMGGIFGFSWNRKHWYRFSTTGNLESALYVSYKLLNELTVSEVITSTSVRLLNRFFSKKFKLDEYPKTDTLTKLLPANSMKVKEFPEELTQRMTDFYYESFTTRESNTKASDDFIELSSLKKGENLDRDVTVIDDSDKNLEGTFWVSKGYLYVVVDTKSAKNIISNYLINGLDIPKHKIRWQTSEG